MRLKAIARDTAPVGIALTKSLFMYGDYSPILSPTAMNTVISTYSSSLAGQRYLLFPHDTITAFAVSYEHVTLILFASINVIFLVT